MVEGSSLVPHCLGLRLPFPLRTKLCVTRVRSVSWLEINFYNANEPKIKEWFMGVWLRSRVSYVTVWYLTPFWGYFILPHVVSLVQLLEQTDPKRIKRKKSATDRRRSSFVLYFSFISWIQQPFNRWRNFPWIQLKWLNPRVKVFKNTLIVSWYMRVLVWYFKALTMVSRFWKFVEVQCFSS